MEVLVGPTFSIDESLSAAAAYVRDRKGVSVQGKVAAAASLFLEVEEEEGRDAGSGRVGGGVGLLGLNKSPGESSESSSSIGAPGDSSEEEEEDDAVSSRGGLGSFSSLQDSLPIKRGLSNHYTGKSKSFANLSEVDMNSVKVLEKVENPFNKRRRVLMASKWSRRSSSCFFYSWQNPKSTPLLALKEDDDGNCNNDNDDDGESKPSSSSSSASSPSPSLKPKLQTKKLMKANSKPLSCFSLTDLQEENQ